MHIWIEEAFELALDVSAFDCSAMRALSGDIGLDLTSSSVVMVLDSRRGSMDQMEATIVSSTSQSSVCRLLLVYLRPIYLYQLYRPGAGYGEKEMVYIIFAPTLQNG